MSKQLINEYYNNYDRAIQFGKSKNEQSIRTPFLNLLNYYARKQNYELVAEVSTQGTKGAKVRPDGILKNLFGLDNGLWESKDEKDTIDDEIDAKRKKGYPFNNILFEDSNVAVLFQRGEEVMRCKVRDADALHKILTAFVTFKSETVYKFETALENFKADIPSIVDTLRKRIEEAFASEGSSPLGEDAEGRRGFTAAANSFLELCKAEINPEITLADVREMMIQHILTADIFNKIFDDPEFHRHNNIARELEKLNEILFTHTERRNLLGEIEHYYDTINACASGITDHHEKQKFLKVLYENFYKVYNPKAADRLGVVYTPNEIVNFMIESTNHLLEKHFGKNLGDKNVDILDPATGTGTFITSIIDSIPKQNLAHKYQHELHANEVAILPYYIANLNIEFTYKQKMGYYDEFKNLCFVDTLDNTASLAYSGKQHSLFGLSSENAQRIKNQNSKKISVVIGNPPYNAKQENYNYQNANKGYEYVDKRIKDTFVKYGTAQNQNVVYDMYTRFYRWAMDRLDNNGVLAFITNRSFIDGKTFDGFRKCIADEFSHAYIVDTKTDIRATKEKQIAGTTHNVFGIQTGIAIMFLVKKEKHESDCNIQYVAMEDNWRKEVKLDWLRNNRLENIAFEKITPNKNNWINIADTNFEDLIPIANKESKAGKSSKVIFQSYSAGLQTSRDEWVYDLDIDLLKNKMKFYSEEYNKCVEAYLQNKGKESIGKFKSDKIKWSSSLEQYLERGLKFNIKPNLFKRALYRPFIKQNFYFDRLAVHRVSLNHELFGEDLSLENKVLTFITGIAKPFTPLSVDGACDINFLSPAAGGTYCLPLYRYDQNGKRIENITDWGLEQFQKHYSSHPQTPEGGLKDKKQNAKAAVSPLSFGEGSGERSAAKAPPSEGLGRLDIFHYTYAVLHNPAYRKKYELNLKREFPRLPFYKDFWQWAAWGKQLMDLHINYEKAKPYELMRIETQVDPTEKKMKEMLVKSDDPEDLLGYKWKLKAKLKANKAEGTIELDEQTTLSNIPAEAWDYKLGNRSALEWILDQYKEKKPGDPTIAEKFNTYKFADYKEQVIDLLQRVCTVSVETMKVVREMEKEKE